MVDILPIIIFVGVLWAGFHCIDLITNGFDN